MGKEITIDQAVSCIRKHRDAPNLAQPTYSVSFPGPELMEWMNKTAAKMRSAGRGNFGFSMVLGQLTKEFLEANNVEPSRIELLTGRTSIFIVPYATDASGATRLADTGEGFSAYDLGTMDP